MFPNRSTKWTFYGRGNINGIESQDTTVTCSIECLPHEIKIEGRLWTQNAKVYEFSLRRFFPAHHFITWNDNPSCHMHEAMEFVGKRHVDEINSRAVGEVKSIHLAEAWIQDVKTEAQGHQVLATE